MILDILIKYIFKELNTLGHIELNREGAEFNYSINKLKLTRIINSNHTLYSVKYEDKNVFLTNDEYIRLENTFDSLLKNNGLVELYYETL